MSRRLVVRLVVLAAFFPRVGAAELSPAELKEAGKIYLVKCGKCHEFYDPKTYSDTAWGEWMVKMARKSKLKEPQADLMNRYTGEIRAGRVAAPRK